ncbi:hypothetical protein [Chitinolyticbacter meiyuanensis]|uniref:hypothetical protein n=1 Tax=Chitinolyticbacter meiyuanensis TaxID=682798 RepID=UPI0011E5FC1D|nr:hypothetical protein [Chitinolyticbacter meiyuanensis]
MEQRITLGAGQAQALWLASGATLRVERGAVQLLGELDLLAGQSWQMRYELRQGETYVATAGETITLVPADDSVLLHRAPVSHAAGARRGWLAGWSWLCQRAGLVDPRRA